MFCKGVGRLTSSLTAHGHHILLVLAVDHVSPMTVGIVATNKSKGVNSGHAKASERVQVRHGTMWYIWVLLLTSERVRVRHRTEGTKTNCLRYI